MHTYLCINNLGLCVCVFVYVWQCCSAVSGRSLGAGSWHIRVFPRLVPRPVPRIITVLLRVPVCVCVFILPEHFPFSSFSSHSRSVLRPKPVVPSVICVLFHKERVYYANETKEEGRAEGQRGTSAMEIVECVCWCFEYLPESLQSQPLIWPLPGNSVCCGLTRWVCVWTGKQHVPPVPLLESIWGVGAKASQVAFGVQGWREH